MKTLWHGNIFPNYVPECEESTDVRSTHKDRLIRALVMSLLLFWLTILMDSGVQQKSDDLTRISRHVGEP